MSTDYTFGLTVGLEVDFDQIVKQFSEKRPEKAHTEKRFDTASGKRLPDLKVIDQEAGTYLVINGDEYDPEGGECPEIAEALSEHYGCQVELANDSAQSTDETVLIFRPNGMDFADPSTDCTDYGHSSGAGGVDVEALAGALPALLRLKEELAKKGLVASAPMVRITGGYG